MLTIRTRDENGIENVHETSRVIFDPNRFERGAVMVFCPGGEDTEIINGMVFVMNEAGKTVAIYNLGKPLADQKTAVIK